QQRPESGLAAEDGVVPAQGGEAQQGQEYRHTPPLGRLEGRLSIECIGPNPREFWCVSPACNGQPGRRGSATSTTSQYCVTRLGGPAGSPGHCWNSSDESWGLSKDGCPAGES